MEDSFPFVSSLTKQSGIQKNMYVTELWSSVKRPCRLMQNQSEWLKVVSVFKGVAVKLSGLSLAQGSKLQIF